MKINDFWKGVVSAIAVFLMLISLVFMSIDEGDREHETQKLMRESWTEGYDQGYGDAYFKLTGDEEGKGDIK